MSSTEAQSVAVVHDQFEIIGGAEHVAIEMARTLDAPLYAGVVDHDRVPDDVEVHELFTSKLGQRCMDSHYLVQDAYQMIGWQHQPDLWKYDTLVVSKNNPGWYVPRDYQAIVRMVYSPPRGPYDMFYRRGSGVLSPAIKTFIRGVYEQNYSYPDEWVAISELVDRRMGMYNGFRADEIIYPPIYTSEYGPDCAGSDGDYYFTVGRLVGHKHVDDMVEAFTDHHPDKRLVVAGEGRARNELEDMAGPNVEFVGYIDDEEKRRRLAECTAFLFNANNEDFGLTVPEALASGTPAIGVRDGYTPSQIADGQTGILFDRGVDNLAAAIARFEREGVTATPAECQQATTRYDIEPFRSQLRAVVDRASTRAREQRSADPPAPARAAPLADGSGGAGDE